MQGGAGGLLGDAPLRGHARTRPSGTRARASAVPEQLSACALPPEAIELSKGSRDTRPEYADSLAAIASRCAW